MWYAFVLYVVPVWALCVLFSFVFVCLFGFAEQNKQSKPFSSVPLLFHAYITIVITVSCDVLHSQLHVLIPFSEFLYIYFPAHVLRLMDFSDLSTYSRGVCVFYRFSHW